MRAGHPDCRIPEEALRVRDGLRPWAPETAVRGECLRRAGARTAEPGSAPVRPGA